MTEAIDILQSIRHFTDLIHTNPPCSCLQSVQGEIEGLVDGLASPRVLEHLQIEMPHFTYRGGYYMATTELSFDYEDLSLLPYFIDYLADGSPGHFSRR